MQAITAIETKKNELLASCYEQLIIHENIEVAFNVIAEKLVNHFNAKLCAFVIQKPYLKFVKFNAQSLVYNEAAIDDFLAEVNLIDKQKIKIINGEVSILNKYTSVLNIQTLLSCPVFHHEENIATLLIGHSTYFNWNEYLPTVLSLSSVFGNAIASQNLKLKLYKRNEVFQSTLATLNQIIWELDVRTNTIHTLGFAQRIGKLKQQRGTIDFVKFLSETVHHEDRERVIANYKKTLLQPDKSVNEIIYRTVSSDNENYIWVQTKQTLLCDENGNAAIIVGTTTDIHDTKQVALELEKHKEQNEFLVQMLQESNEKLNKILNSSKEIILTIDLETGQIEDVNDAINILGYTPNEWKGQYYTKWSLEKRRKFHDLLKHASESDTTIRSQQILFATKNLQEEIPFEFSTSVFYFKNKKYLLCVLRNIKERVEYEKSISKITEQLTHLINNIDDVYAIYNLKEDKYEFVSNNIEGFFGCSKSDFTSHGLFWKEIIHIEDAASIIKQMHEVIKNKARGEFFYRITTPVGESKMILEKLTVAVDDKGNADKVYIVKSDYTHIENAEQNLIESERKFRFISENITDFISIIDNDGRFLYASPSAEKVIGYSAEELIGEGSIYLIHPEDITKFIEDVLEKAVFHKTESHLRYRILAKNGNYYWVETYFKPILDVKNETASIICSTRDVTEREQLMKDLELSLEKERELNELRSQFVSTASHQFRTPLTVIQSGVELMEIYLEDLPEQKQNPFKKQFNKIHAEVSRLQDLMNDVLLLGRADATRTPYNPTKGNLINLCDELIESKFNNRFKEDRRVKLTVFGNAQDVYFDAKLLDHALENILTNAYKYSEKGNIEMKIQFDFETVTISITDEGIGIPESDLVNLFQPFYRAGNTTEIEGTGLGLSIVKEFIDKHGGEIFVLSELNKGTTVNVVLPLALNKIEKQ